MALKDSLKALELNIDTINSVDTELSLLQSNLTASASIFKTKVGALVKGLKAREVSTEQIINVLLDDFDNDGAMFGGLKRAWTNDAKSSIGNIDIDVTVDEWENRTEGQKYTWISALKNTCGDCLPMHGTSDTYANFRSNPGLPRTGWSVCGSSCKCLLVPSSVADSKAELQEPIKRAKKIIRKEATELNKTGKARTEYINRKIGKIRNKKDNLRKDYLKKKII